MRPGNRAVDRLARYARAGLALLRSTAARPSAPLKINFSLTYRCQYRCKTCNIWQRRPTGELTTDEVLAFVRRNPHITWADLTGGEIFLRADIGEILEAIVGGWRRLAFLHFPTNGFQTDRIVRHVAGIAGRGPASTIVTVSLDGDEQTNDDIRGIKGGFRRQIETFAALRRIPGVRAVLGVTLSSCNAGRLARTFEACAREVTGLTMRDVHLNVAQVSGHYYGNTDAARLRPDPALLLQDLAFHRTRRRPPRSAAHLLENTFLRYSEQYLRTGEAPMPCHALRASCFIDPSGVVYPCISYSKPIGRLRDTGMRLDPIWNAAGARQLQREIWNGACPQCWTACEAYQSILGNVLAGRLRPPRADRALPVLGAPEQTR